MSSISLRPYQLDGVEEIRQAFREGHRRALFVLPTGGGKTLTFSYIAREAAAKGKKVTICMHRRELVRQTIDKLGYRHGVISAGFHSRPAEAIQIASVQTWVNRFDRTPKPDLVIIDEAHHSKAGTWLQVINQFPDALLLGVTATPIRMDKSGLGDIYTKMIVGPSISDLVAQGHLAPPLVYAPSQPDLAGVKSQYGDFVKKALMAAVDKPKITGDAVAHYHRHAHNKPAIAFCVSVAHAEHVAETFRRAGYNAASVDGKLEQRERDQRIADLANGRLHVLTSCDLISEGVDVPVVAAGILLRPTQSLGLYMQQVGRILRPSPGKDHALILDHAGNCLRHGLPDQDRDWQLLTSANKASAAGESNGPPIRQCPQCYNVHITAPACPRCGHVYTAQEREIAQVDGDLVQVSREQIEAEKQRAKFERRREIAQCDTYEALAEYGRKNGYKPGWARIIWESRASRRKAAAV